MDKRSTVSAELQYAAIQPDFHQIEDATIAVRVVGKGPALVLIHGYPVSGYTWRKLLPTLAKSFTCYVIDLPGLGDSGWTPETDFSFTAQARRLDLLVRKLGLKDIAIIAHDTGATIARMVALLQQKNVNKLVIINTEIPGHRPPWVQFYQFMASLPFSRPFFKAFLNTPMFVRSPLGLGQFYSDRSLFDSPGYMAPYIDPLVNDPRRLKGALSYLKGIEWSVVDALEERHRDISAEVLFLWGEDDKTFPVNLAEEMCSQFKREPIFVRLPSSSLMPQEEKPGEALKHLLPFLSRTA